MIDWINRTRQVIQPRLVRFVRKIPEYLPNWSRPVLKPFYGIYEYIYGKAHSSIKEEMLVHTPMGLYIYVNYWDFVEREIANGTYEKRYADFFCSKVQEGDVVVDVGAHIGYFSLLASERVGDEGYVYSFEPVPRNYERLMRNLKVNQVENVKAYNLGLSDKSETLSFSVPREIPAEATLCTITWSEISKIAKLHKDVVRSKLVPFDWFYEIENLEKISKVKIDQGEK